MLTIYYPYKKYIESVRIHRTVHYLRQCSPPFLDVGAGSKKISRAVGALTVDINRKHKPDVVASILYLPFRDGCFETVSAFEVIEHLDNDELALQELIRVSRKKIILSVPNSFRHNLPLLPKKKKKFHEF